MFLSCFNYRSIVSLNDTVFFRSHRCFSFLFAFVVCKNIFEFSVCMLGAIARPKYRSNTVVGNVALAVFICLKFGSHESDTSMKAVVINELGKKLKKIYNNLQYLSNNVSKNALGKLWCLSFGSVCKGNLY